MKTKTIVVLLFLLLLVPVVWQTIGSYDKLAKDFIDEPYFNYDFRDPLPSLPVSLGIITGLWLVFLIGILMIMPKEATDEPQ